jgi:polyisoprenoid-binding protein YceI
MTKMKYVFSIIASLALAFSVNANIPAGNVSMNVDINASTVIWKGAKVTGKHHGTIQLKSGSLDFENGTLVGGNFTIDMTTIQNSDMGEKMKAKLEGHLKSDDFFGVERFPTSTLKFTKVIPYGTTGSYKIVADLTIKGKTNPVKFSAQINSENKTATATITVDRSEYDVRYRSGSFFDNLGDKTIYDEFDLEIELVMAEA